PGLHVVRHHAALDSCCCSARRSQLRHALWLRGGPTPMTTGPKWGVSLTGSLSQWMLLAVLTSPGTPGLRSVAVRLLTPPPSAARRPAQARVPGPAGGPGESQRSGSGLPTERARGTGRAGPALGD